MSDEIILRMLSSNRGSGYQFITLSYRRRNTKSKIYKQLDANKIVNSYGVFGRYQTFGYLLCQLLNFTYASTVYVMSYIQLNPYMECKNELEENIEIDESCWISNSTLKEQCGRNHWTQLTLNDSQPVTSIVMEFGLTCQHYFWKEASIIFFTIGAIVTVPITSTLADRIGRRPVLLGSLSITFVVSILAALAPNFESFLLCRFIIGGASDTYISIVAILTCELISTHSRAWISLVYTLAWALGMFYVGLLSLFVHEWRWMYMMNSIPSIFFVLYFYWMPESPHWLVLKKRAKEIKQYIKTSNKWSNCEIDIQKCLDSDSLPTEDEVHQNPKFSAVFKNATIRKYIVINGFIQFCLALYYFGISFMSVDLSENRFTAYMISAFVEIPGGLMVIPLMMYFGRREVIGLSLIVQGVLLAVVPFFSNIGPVWVPTFFMLAGKLVNSVAYTIHPIYASEMMPTSVRSFAFSIINIPQSLGIIIAPLFKHIGSTSTGTSWVKFVVVGACCCVGAISLLFLPETKDCMMPSNISDEEDSQKICTPKPTKPTTDRLVEQTQT